MKVMHAMFNCLYSGQAVYLAYISVECQVFVDLKPSTNSKKATSNEKKLRQCMSSIVCECSLLMMLHQMKSNEDSA